MENVEKFKQVVPRRSNDFGCLGEMDAALTHMGNDYDPENRTLASVNIDDAERQMIFTKLMVIA